MANRRLAIRTQKWPAPARHAGLIGGVGGSAAKRQEDGKGAAVRDRAAYFNAPAMFFHDAARQRQAQPRPVSFGGVEGAENMRQMLRGNSAASVADSDSGHAVVPLHSYSDLSAVVDGLDGVEQQVEQHLIDLIAVVLHLERQGIVTKLDVDRLG